MADEEAGTVSVKLKVLYTFDAEHKVDHLSRPPQSFQVDTAPIDESTTIGIIDLKSCLDVIITSSPELTHFDEGDYTVYAYDYSEPNVPLVGQGMLSKVLSQAAASSEAMVTGKIIQSLMAKFKKNAEPFLEVKLRLTPIASSFSRARSGSMSSVHEPVTQPYPGFQGQPMPLDRPSSPADMSRLDSVHRTLHQGSQRRDSGYGQPQPWAPSSRPSSRPGTPNHQYMPPMLHQPVSQHSVQPPLQWQNYGPAPPMARRGSESGYYSGEDTQDGPARKRARITRVQATKKMDFNIEQQPSSLRTAAMGASSVRIHQPAPVQPVPIQPAAALQRGFSAEEPVRPPTPIPPKPRITKKPTGRPKGRPRTKQQRLAAQSRAGSVEPSSPTLMPLPRLVDSNASSPEDNRDARSATSAQGSPVDMPSSPPMLPMHTLATSPKLPEHSPLSRNDSAHDSGFFSGQAEPDAGDKISHKELDPQDMDDFFKNIDPQHFGEMSWLDNMEDIPLDISAHLNLPGAENHYTPVFEEDSTVGGPTPQPDAQFGGPTPTPAQALSQHNVATPSEQPTPHIHNTSMSMAPMEAPSNSSFPKPILPASAKNQQGSSASKSGRLVPALLPRPQQATLQRSLSELPPVPASDPGIRAFQRSITCGPDIMSDAIRSDALGPEDGTGGKRSRRRIGKEQTKKRLEDAIEAGKMPPFCSNCGAIETPAWRRGWTKVFACDIDTIETGLNTGEICYKEVLERDDDENVKTWKGYRTELLPNEKLGDGWEQINLCNPCGLWFHKTKTPRPEAKWQTKKDPNAPKEKRKRKRPPKPPKSRTNPPRAAAGNIYSDVPQSDMQEPGSEDSSPADTAMEDTGDDTNDNMTVNEDSGERSQEPELPPCLPIVMSTQPVRRTVKWADVPDRQIQSSPVVGNTADRPIDVDLTPNKPLRRRLFSPTSLMKVAENERPALSENVNELLPSFVRRSPRLNKTRDLRLTQSNGVAIVVGMGAEEVKENVSPHAQDTDFDDLFNYNDNDDLMLPPATPTLKRRSERLLRTPGRTPSREFDSEGMARTPNAQIRTPSQSSRNLADFFLDTVTRSLDPDFMTPNTRAMHKACYGLSTPTPKRTRFRTGFTPKTHTPGKAFVTMDFPDLPSLKPSSPMSGLTNDPYSELPTERLGPNMDDWFDTDLPIPSSPPLGLQNEGHSGQEDDFGGIFNFDLEVTVADDDATTRDLLRTPKKQSKLEGMLDVHTPGSSSLRRSPRRAGRG